MNARRSPWRGRLEGAAGIIARDPRQLFEIAVDQMHRAVEPLRAGPTGERRPLEEVAAGLERALGTDVVPYLEEEGRAEIEADVAAQVERLGPDLPFSLENNAAPSLARLCYALARALRPDTVLETGVAYGVSSSFILKALELNGHGQLHSVDRPPTRPGVDDYIGALVPDALRSRWVLHRGTSRRLLPGLLPRLDRPSMFLHDSQHTYRNIAWELRTVGPHLIRPAAVLVDDPIGNRAFEHWVERERPAFAGVVETEMVGAAVLTA